MVSLLIESYRKKIRRSDYGGFKSRGNLYVMKKGTTDDTVTFLTLLGNE